MAVHAESARSERIARALGIAVLGASLMAAARAVRRAEAKQGANFLRNHGVRPAPPPTPPRVPARSLRSAASLLAVSVLVDSGVEHKRGGFRNMGMYAPIAISALVVGADLSAISGDRGSAGRDVVHRSALALSIAGLGFHAWDLARRPGGVGWQNLFYAAPIGAPAALGLAGLLGFAADHLRLDRSGHVTLAGLPAGRALGVLVATGLVGTSAEAGLLHFRGSFQSRYMWLPVTMPPVAAAMLVIGAARPSRRRLSAARGWLRLTAVLGLGGVAFHARGISRMMGGWRNWSQNVADGPPLPAPPSFSALALAGLAALSLMERDHV